MTIKTNSNDIKQAQGFLVKKQFAHAKEISERILSSEPSNFDALLIKTIALQHQNLPTQALQCLQQIKRQQGDNSPLTLIEVQLLQQIGHHQQAALIAQTALNKQPENANLWRELSQALYKTAQYESAERAFKQYLLHSAEHPLLRDSLEALLNEQLPKAERAVRSFLQQYPNNVSGLRLLAEIALKLGILNDAQVLLEKALSIAPNYHLARLNYAHTLNKREKSQLALVEIMKVESAQPNHIPMLLVKAAILVKLSDFKRAVEVYQNILTNHNNQPSIWCSLGHAQKTLGMQKEAVESYHKAIELDPNYTEPYWSLANLKTYSFSDADFKNMLLASTYLEDKTDDNAAHICFALGSAYEKRKEFDQSFAFYEKGNKIKQQLEPYDAAGVEELVDRNIRYFSDNHQKASASVAPTPIFIVGLPRSGSTLLEQILASHSMVDGTRELPDILSIARQLGNKKRKNDEDMYPQSLQNLSLAELETLGNRYLSDTAHYRNGAPYFIDKMPNNFLHIGLIKTILPNAKIIDARRHPMSTCFSCFKQLFAVGQTFSNSLPDLAHYYSNYLKMMSFWKSVYPDDVLTVHYEDVVTSLEQQVDQMLTFLELPFESQCIDFYSNSRAVATASSEQVRQPINTKGLDAWRPYKAHLGQLKVLSN